MCTYYKPPPNKGTLLDIFLADLNVGSYHQTRNEDIGEIINGTLSWDSITLFALIY